MEEKSYTFLSVTVSVFAFCLQQIPHTLCELLTLQKKDTILFHNITIEIFSILTPPTYALWCVFVQVWILCSLQCEGADSTDSCGKDQRKSPVAWQIKEKKVQLQKLEAYFSQVFMHLI
jgi:hypothetical protein